MTTMANGSPTAADREFWTRGWRMSKGRLGCVKCPAGNRIKEGAGTYFTGEPGDVMCKPHAESVGVLAPTWAK